jgi:hypothetical protein
MPLVIAATSSRPPRHGLAPTRATILADASLRANAVIITSRATSFSMRGRPTKPDPPVTKACFMLHLSFYSIAIEEHT